MKFLIQHNEINPAHLPVIRDALTGLPHEFVGMLDEIVASEPLKGCDYIPYGSCAMVREAARLGFVGVHFNSERFTCSAALAGRDDMLNRGEILRARQAVTRLRRASGHWFIRPDADLKTFAGRILPAREAAALLSRHGDVPVLLTRPLEIETEWRWFIVGGQVISGSRYRHLGKPGLERVTDPVLIREAQERAKGWLPDQSCVMDLARAGGEMRVVEFNCINGSGFYRCDIAAILHALWAHHAS